ncbi:MAG: biotin transporter BioY [Azospirillaceae bacterium]
MSTRDIVHIALFAALTAALGLFPPITLPLTGVPITAQSMGLMLAGSIIGARRGALSQVLLLVLVAVGFPLLAGGRGGIGVFAGPTAGFLLAWPVGAFVVGWLFERYWGRLTIVSALPILAFGGIVVVYAIGVPGISLATGLPLPQALVGSLPFIPGDLVKVGLTALIALTVRRSYPLIAARS